LTRSLSIEAEEFPIAGRFTISRGSKTSAHVLSCRIEAVGKVGCGECVPYARYGESMDGVRDAIEAVRAAIEAGANQLDIAKRLPAGAARNAVDCALWDLDARTTGVAVSTIICAAMPSPLVTAYTLSLGDAEEMGAQARANSFRPVLKVKVGGEDDEARIRAIRAGAPESSIILDANEGWTEANVVRHMAIAAECGVSLIEQPLPAGRDGMLADVSRPVLVCADESLHTRADLASLRSRYDAVNIKLDKTGGLSEAILLKQEAQKLGFQIMVGCMVGTSLAMAPAVLLAQDAQFVDLDGPLLLARDRVPGLRYDGSLVYPPTADLWG
jgi:L-alanine-DL-glutamate epimerase-like enolase superfamily enzyme